MKLFKICVRTYYYGNVEYVLFVLADSVENAKKTLYQYPRYKRDEDAEIKSVEEIDLNNTENRVL